MEMVAASMARVTLVRSSIDVSPRAPNGADLFFIEVMF
jgi:hypothetical protein